MLWNQGWQPSGLNFEWVKERKESPLHALKAQFLTSSTHITWISDGFYKSKPVKSGGNSSHLQACHDNLQLSCCLEPFELPPLFEQSLAQNSVIHSPQLDNMPHSRHACNHATSSVVAVNIVCPLSTWEQVLAIHLRIKDPEGGQKKVQHQIGEWTKSRHCQKHLWEFRLSPNWRCAPSHHICSQSTKVLAYQHSKVW